MLQSWICGVGGDEVTDVLPRPQRSIFRFQSSTENCNASLRDRQHRVGIRDNLFIAPGTAQEVRFFPCGYTGSVKQQATVVYADILGFSDLVMSMSGAIGLLDGFYYSTMSLAQLRESFAEPPIPDPLTQTFAAFHRALDIHISDLVNVDPLQSIVFSDSAFVVFRDLNTAIYFAQVFMRDLISFRVPVRMGIGRGSFRGLRLTTDISDEVRRHSSQFLGTGVIRAHQAESCGLKGLRIFIHPDADMKENWPGDFCAVPEITEPQRVARPITQELNYIPHEPEFIPRAGGAQTADDAYGEIVTAVTAMMNASPARTRVHYEQTFAALARMRDAYKGQNSQNQG